MPVDYLRILVLLTVTFFVGITGFIIYFIVLYRNRQLKNKQEQEQLQSRFKQEILKAQIEMQEQTLTHVSREIHDNITQVLSFVKLNLAMMAKTEEPEKRSGIDETRELVSQAITDLRDLSKSLSFEQIKISGLLKTIEIDTKRINKSAVIKTILTAEGEVYSLGHQRELVLFRIFQESLNNSLKHSGVKHFKIGLQYHRELFNLTLEDDGVGFSKETFGKGDGSGLRNIGNRAALIGAIATIDSAPDKGCIINISLNPLEQQSYIDEDHSNRIG